jgi:hypothetical protein
MMSLRFSIMNDSGQFRKTPVAVGNKGSHAEIAPNANSGSILGFCLCGVSAFYHHLAK